MDELRWILLGLGVVIIVGVYGYARLQDWRREGPPWRRRGSAQREPFAGYDEPDIGADDPLTVDPLDATPDAGFEDDGIIGPARVVGADPSPPDESVPEPAERHFDGADHRDPPADMTDDDRSMVAEASESRAEPPIPAFLRARGRQRSASGSAGEEQRPPISPAPASTAREPEPEPEPEPEMPTTAPEPVEAPELDLGFPPEPEPAPTTTAPQAGSKPTAADGEEKVVALSVMAPAGRQYDGADLASVLESAGLRLTPQGIFRRGLDTGEGTIALFTAANIIEPGTFDAENPGSVSTPGVVLIMQLPGPFDGLATFEQMLTTARRIADTLGGQLLDGRRCDLTTQAIEHIREELLEYRRRAHLASRSRRRG